MIQMNVGMRRLVAGQCDPVDLWLNGENVSDDTAEAVVHNFPGVPAWGRVRKVIRDGIGQPFQTEDGKPLFETVTGVVWWLPMDTEQVH